MAAFRQLATAILLSGAVLAHPAPDVPVRGSFADGAVRIEVEVDARCFEADPTTTPYLTNAVLGAMDERAKAGLVKQAMAFVRRSVEFSFAPSGEFEPTFSFRFTTHGGKALEKADDPVMITGSWESKLPEGAEGYRIEALPEGKLSVVFLNHISGSAEAPKIHVLFPGEKSYTLDIGGV